MKALLIVALLASAPVFGMGVVNVASAVVETPAAKAIRAKIETRERRLAELASELDRAERAANMRSLALASGDRVIIQMAMADPVPDQSAIRSRMATISDEIADLRADLAAAR
jgi:hypothetical protein